MIVITAPTGNIGRHVVRHLLDASAPVRVIARDGARLAPDVRDRVELVEGSHADAAVVDRAFADAEALFWLVPPNPRRTLEQAYVEFSRPAADALARHRVRRVVSITALGRGTAWQDRAGLVTASIHMDDLLMSTGVAFRGLAMPSFMDNVLQQLSTLKEQGALYGTIDAHTKQPTTATRDMGAAAAKLLADGSWSGQQEIALLGPEDLSMDDMAAIMSDALGRVIRYQQVSLDSFQDQLAGRGMSTSFVQGYGDMMRAKGEGMDVQAWRDDAWPAPTSFAQWCRDTLVPAFNA